MAAELVCLLIWHSSLSLPCGGLFLVPTLWGALLCSLPCYGTDNQRHENHLYVDCPGVGQVARGLRTNHCISALGDRLLDRGTIKNQPLHLPLQFHSTIVLDIVVVTSRPWDRFAHRVVSNTYQVYVELTLLQAQSRLGDESLGIRVTLSPKRECGSKRV